MTVDVFFHLNCVTLSSKDRNWRSRTCSSHEARGFAYGFLFNTHLASRERKTRSRSRKVIFPLASLDRREPLQVPPFQLGSSSIESRAFLLFIWRCRAHSRIWRTKRRRRGLSCIERGKQLIWHRRRPGIHFVLK